MLKSQREVNNSQAARFKVDQLDQRLWLGNAQASDNFSIHETGPARDARRPS